MAIFALCTLSGRKAIRRDGLNAAQTRNMTRLLLPNGQHLYSQEASHDLHPATYFKGGPPRANYLAPGADPEVHQEQ